MTLAIYRLGVKVCKVTLILKPLERDKNEGFAGRFRQAKNMHELCLSFNVRASLVVDLDTKYSLSDIPLLA